MSEREAALESVLKDCLQVIARVIPMAPMAHKAGLRELYARGQELVGEQTKQERA